MAVVHHISFSFVNPTDELSSVIFLYKIIKGKEKVRHDLLPPLNVSFSTSLFKVPINALTKGVCTSCREKCPLLELQPLWSVAQLCCSVLDSIGGAESYSVSVS